MNTFTIEGTLKDAKNNAIASKYVKFRITSVGTDTEDNVTYPRDTVEFQTDASGDFSGTLWINGDSGVECFYEIRMPDNQIVEVVIPSAVEGTTVRLEDIIENYQVNSSTQQSTVYNDAIDRANHIGTQTLSTISDAGSIASQDANSVAITGGSITGITDLAIADGGTGASDASTARTNLGVAIGSDVLAYDAQVQAIADMTPTDSTFIVGNGTTFASEDATTARASLGLDSMALQDSTAVAITGGSVTGITDITVADGGTGASTASDARANLGLVIGTNVQAYDAQLAEIAALAVTDGNIIVGDGTNWVAESGATARTSLGLGSGDNVTHANITATGQLTTNSSVKAPWKTVNTTPYTVLATDYKLEVDDDTVGSAVTLNLPAAATVGNGFELLVLKGGSTANVIVDGSGSETINGALTQTLVSQYDSFKISTNGTTWFIIEA